MLDSPNLAHVFSCNSVYFIDYEVITTFDNCRNSDNSWLTGVPPQSTILTVQDEEESDSTCYSFPDLLPLLPLLPCPTPCAHGPPYAFLFLESVLPRWLSQHRWLKATAPAAVANAVAEAAATLFAKKISLSRKSPTYHRKSITSSRRIGIPTYLHYQHPDQSKEYNSTFPRPMRGIERVA